MRTALVFAGAYAAVAVAVALGGFASADQWAVDHVMAWVSTEFHPVSAVSALRPVQPWTPGPQVAADLWLYPASVPLSALGVGAACAFLWRRERRPAAVAWAAAWLVGNGVEVLCKSVVERPALHALGHHLIGFDDSFPSGHALRGLLLAAALGLVRPRLRPVCALWAASALVLLVVASWHTPSDVLGGALLAGVFAAPAATVTRRRA